MPGTPGRCTPRKRERPCQRRRVSGAPTKSRTMSPRSAVSLPGRSTQVLGDRVDTRCGEVPEHLDCFGERRVLSGDQAQSVRSGRDGLVDLGEALARLGIHDAAGMPARRESVLRACNAEARQVPLTLISSPDDVPKVGEAAPKSCLHPPLASAARRVAPKSMPSAGEAARQPACHLPGWQSVPDPGCRGVGCRHGRASAGPTAATSAGAGAGSAP